MLKEDITEERKKRHAITQEDFTPPEIVCSMLDSFGEEAFSNIKKTVIDFSAGNGNFLVEALHRKLSHAKNINQAITCLQSIYGIELMADNVEDCRWRLYDVFISLFPEAENDYDINFKVRSIIKNRIQWHDSLTFDYDNWPRLSMKVTKNNKVVHFNEVPTKENTKFPMWYKDPTNKVAPVQLSLF